MRCSIPSCLIRIVNRGYSDKEEVRTSQSDEPTYVYLPIECYLLAKLCLFTAILSIYEWIFLQPFLRCCVVGALWA